MAYVYKHPTYVLVSYIYCWRCMKCMHSVVTKWRHLAKSGHEIFPFKKSLLQWLCILPESKGIIRHGFVALVNLSGVEDNVNLMSTHLVTLLSSLEGWSIFLLGLGELKQTCVAWFSCYLRISASRFPGPRKTLTKSDAGTVLIDAIQSPRTDAKTKKKAQEALELLWRRARLVG
jgi:hypothetical protein